jgi:hypothetical protein
LGRPPRSILVRQRRAVDGAEQSLNRGRQIPRHVTHGIRIGTFVGLPKEGSAMAAGRCWECQLPKAGMQTGSAVSGSARGSG